MSQIRQYFYLFTGLVSSILPILVIFKVVNDQQVSSINDLILALGGLLGAAGATTAGVVVAKQRKNGTLGGSPVDAVINGIPAVVQQAQDATDDVQRVREAWETAIGSIPTVGPLAQQVINQINRQSPSI